MFQEPGGLPISGGIFLALLLYVAICFVVTGPLIGGRTIQKSAWDQTCRAHIRAAVEVDEAPPLAVPKIGCSTIFGWFGREGEAFCEVHGDRFDNNPFNKLADSVQEQQREFSKKRLDRAASLAGSRCECAVTTTLEQRYPFALYAGSLRLVVPPEVKALQSELIAALNSPRCAAKGAVR